MTEPSSSVFRWVPGQGPEVAALERMQRAFPKPKEAMGEAWFMAPERMIYPELFRDLSSLSDDEIGRPLEEIAGGPTCFGQRDEWTEWYHYLLPRLMVRSWGSYIYHPMEILITGFMSQHPDPAIVLPYRAFREDALATLGRYIMSPHCWPGGNLDVAKCLNKFQYPSGLLGWFDADGLLSASLFFCLKYLAVDAVGAWFRSVLEIPDRHWKAQVILWLVGAHPILSGAISQPAQFPMEGQWQISWNWSHVLDGKYSGNYEEPLQSTVFLPECNRMEVLHVVGSSNLSEFLEDWQTAPDLQALAAETAGVPERFIELYRQVGSSG